MKARIQAIAEAFADLKTTIHPDHQPKAAALAVMIEQAHEAADEPPTPATIDHVAEGLELVKEELADLRTAVESWVEAIAEKA